MSDVHPAGDPDRSMNDDSSQADHGPVGTTVADAAVGASLVALDGSFIRVDRAFRDMLGYSDGELVGKSSWSLMHPDDAEAARSWLGSLADLGPGAYRTECRYLHRDGHVVWVDLSGTLLHEADGRPLYYATHVVDITGRKRAEAALRESEERFRTAFERSPMGMTLTALDGMLIDGNEAFCSMVGYPREELPSLSSLDLMHPDDAPAMAELGRRLLSGETDSEHMEKRYLGPDGREVWAEASVSLVRDADGAPLHFITHQKDITERLRHEGEMKDAVKWMQSLWAAMPGGVLVIGADGTIAEANDVACELLGLARERLLGSTLHDPRWDAIREDGSPFPAEERPMLVALRTGRPVQGVVVGLRGGDANRLRWFLSNAEPIVDRDSGQPHAAIATFVDITARREAEREAEEQTKLLRSILAASPVGISLIRDRTPVWGNDAMVTIAGYSMEEQTARGSRLLYADDAEHERVGRALYGGGAGPRPREVDTTWVRKDGAEVHVHLAARPLDVNDPSRGWLVTVMDITERRRHEVELMASLERYRGLHAAMPGGLLVYDADGILTDATEAAAAIFGEPVDRLLGTALVSQRWHAVREDGSPLGDFRPSAITLSTGESVRNAVIGLCDSETGGCRWLLVNSEPQVDRVTGRVVAAVVTLLDISELKRVEADLRESERRFREMADLLPDMLFELDLDLRGTYINRAVTETIGYTQADLAAGLSIADVLSGEDVPLAVESVAAALASKPSLVGVFPANRRDGTTFPAEFHVTRVMGPDGKTVGYRGIARDITDRQKAEDAQRLAAVGQLAAGVAHEFNNLLAVLMMAAEMAAENPADGGTSLLASTAMRVAEGGRDVCRNLTTFARPETPRCGPMAVEAAIDDGLALATQQTVSSGIAVTRDYGTDGRRVHADGGQLGQVFLNLILNACQAMPDGGTLAITTRHVPQAGGAGEIVVTVSDTGTGIAPADLPHIFEPFFTTKGRLHDRGLAGSGLGLSVSHGIIEAHGGRIEARSEVGVGTTFEVVLPAHAEPTPPSQSPAANLAAPATAPAGRAARVLVVEDSAALASLLEAVLTLSGHEVDCVHTTPEAVSILLKGTHELVITDMLMPGGGGREVLAAAGAMDDPPPVIVLTGLLEPHVEEEALAMGASGVLHKPVSRRDLLRTVDRLLGG